MAPVTPARLAEIKHRLDALDGTVDGKMGTEPLSDVKIDSAVLLDRLDLLLRYSEKVVPSLRTFFVAAQAPTPPPTPITPPPVDDVFTDLVAGAMIGAVLDGSCSASHSLPDCFDEVSLPIAVRFVQHAGDVLGLESYRTFQVANRDAAFAVFSRSFTRQGIDPKPFARPTVDAKRIDAMKPREFYSLFAHDSRFRSYDMDLYNSCCDGQQLTGGFLVHRHGEGERQVVELYDMRTGLGITFADDGIIFGDRVTPDCGGGGGHGTRFGDLDRDGKSDQPDRQKDFDDTMAWVRTFAKAVIAGSPPPAASCQPCPRSL